MKQSKTSQKETWYISIKSNLNIFILFIITTIFGMQQLQAQLYSQPSLLPIPPQSIDVGIGQMSPEGRLHIYRNNCIPLIDGMAGQTIYAPKHIFLETEESYGCTPVLNTGNFPSMFQYWDLNGEISSGLRFRTSSDKISWTDLLNLNPQLTKIYSEDIEIGNFIKTNVNQTIINSNAFSVGNYFNSDQNITSFNSTTFTVGNFLTIDASGFIFKNNTNGNNEFLIDRNGLIRAREIKVDLLQIPDFVFQPNYPLMSLDSLQSFISINKHLPGIKSESEFNKDGSINLGELNIKLLEKVEELTLYLLELKKEVVNLENKIRQ